VLKLCVFWDFSIPRFPYLVESKWLENTKRIKDYFFFLNTHLLYSQIWLTLPMDDHHIGYITKKVTQKTYLNLRSFFLKNFKQLRVNKLRTNFLTFILNCSNKRKYFMVFPSHTFSTLPQCASQSAGSSWDVRSKIGYEKSPDQQWTKPIAKFQHHLICNSHF